MGKLTQRRSVLVSADALASVLRDYRVSPVFLEACQTAHAKETSAALVTSHPLPALSFIKDPFETLCFEHLVRPTFQFLERGREEPLFHPVR